MNKYDNNHTSTGLLVHCPICQGSTKIQKIPTDEDVNFFECSECMISFWLTSEDNK